MALQTSLRMTGLADFYVVLDVLGVEAGFGADSVEAGFDSAAVGLDSVEGLASVAGVAAPSAAGLSAELDAAFRFNRSPAVWISRTRRPLATRV